MKRIMKRAAAIVLALVMALSSAVIFQDSEVNAGYVETVDVYRMYNTVSGDHFFTTDINEIDTISGTDSWICEGVFFETFTVGDPVYRLYNPKINQRFYTSDLNEIRVLTTKKGWSLENNGEPMFYSGGNFSIYRLYDIDSCDHIMTPTLGYYNSLRSTDGIFGENIAFYVASVARPFRH